MPSPSNPTYPDVTVQLTGQDGNAFMVIGLIDRALRKQVSPEAAKTFTHEAMEQPSYDHLLRYAASTVNVI